MSLRNLPHPVATFSSKFVFTTLTTKDIQSHDRIPFCHPTNGKPLQLYSLDEHMRYDSFAQDFGPLNLSYTFEACMELHYKLSSRKIQTNPLCLYTAPNPKTKANMVLMVALYWIIIGKSTPAQAFQAVAHFEALPFRDAGSGIHDFGISIQDCLFGMDKALQIGLLNMVDMDIKIYRYYERPQNGDLNILGPFIPFASPVEDAWLDAVRVTETSAGSDGEDVSTTKIRNIEIPKKRLTSHAFKSVLRVFTEQEVGVVVRLNDELYDRRHFLDLGMDHVEMYFDDGSNPSDQIVRDFIKLAEEFIEVKKQKVAVHCKAGLGRTGVLIGAYFIYKYQFTAQEVISYMRIVRPGMVVGPQQHYMMANQMKWVSWAARDKLMEELADATPISPVEPVNPLATPPNEVISKLPLRQSRLQESVILEEVTIKLGSKSPSDKVRYESTTRSRSSSPAVRTSSMPKAGDAMGQPRKGTVKAISSPSTVSGERYVEIGTQVSIVESVVSIHPSVSPTNATRLQASPKIISPAPIATQMRGTKRALTRPVASSSSSSDTHASSTISTERRSTATLQIPPQPLNRTSSTSSVKSSATNVSDSGRPHKKRPGFDLSASPNNASSQSVSSRQHGLSSPPPSREASPADSEDIVMDGSTASPVLKQGPGRRTGGQLRTPPPSATLPSVAAVSSPIMGRRRLEEWEKHTPRLPPLPPTVRSSPPPSTGGFMSIGKKSLIPVRRPSPVMEVGRRGTEAEEGSKEKKAMSSPRFRNLMSRIGAA